MFTEPNVDAVDKRGDTALMWAVRRLSNTAIVQQLLAAGANVNAVNEDRDTAEQIARRYRNGAIADMIRDHQPPGRSIKSAAKR